MNVSKKTITAKINNIKKKGRYDIFVFQKTEKDRVFNIDMYMYMHMYMF